MPHISAPSSRPAARPARQGRVNHAAAKASYLKSQIIEKNNQPAASANIRGLVATRAGSSSLRFVALSSLAILVLLASSIMVVRAALTFSGTTVSGNGSVIIDGAGDLSIGTSTSTGITIGRNGATTTFPGNVVINGSLLGNGSALTGIGSSSVNNAVLYAANYSGADAGAKIQACLDALPSTGGTCDARGLTGNQNIAATITVPAGNILMLGAGIYTSTVTPAIILNSGDQLIGAGRRGDATAASTLIVLSGTSGGSIIKTALTTGDVVIRDLSIYGTNTGSVDGSIGFNLAGGFVSSILSNASANYVDTGVKIGDTQVCDCYSTFENVFVSGYSYGAYFGLNANQDEWFGGATAANKTVGTGFFMGGGNTQAYGVDSENTHTAIEITQAGNAVYNPWIEGDAYGTVLDSGATNNILVNAGDTDNSNADTLANLKTGAAGVPNFILDPYPNWLHAASLLGLGGSRINASSFFLEPHGPGSNTDPGSLRLTYNAPLNAYAPLWLGSLTTFGGINDTGQIVASKLATPSAPTLSVVGTPGSTTVSYAIVCDDFAGGKTLPSSFTQITNAPDSLSSSNYVAINWTEEDGCARVDILKNNTSTELLTRSAYYGTAPDTGQSTSAYTAPTRNTTGDMTVAGNLQEGCAGTATLFSGAATVSDSCIDGSRPIICTDNTATSSVACTAVRASGSLKLYGSGSDTVSWAQL
jgi:hypothetical protein